MPGQEGDDQGPELWQEEKMGEVRALREKLALKEAQKQAEARLKAAEDKRKKLLETIKEPLPDIEAARTTIAFGPDSANPEAAKMSSEEIRTKITALNYQMKSPYKKIIGAEIELCDKDVRRPPGESLSEYTANANTQIAEKQEAMAGFSAKKSDLMQSLTLNERAEDLAANREQIEQRLYVEAANKYLGKKKFFGGKRTSLPAQKSKDFRKNAERESKKVVEELRKEGMSQTKMGFIRKYSAPIFEIKPHTHEYIKGSHKERFKAMISGLTRRTENATPPSPGNVPNTKRPDRTNSLAP